MNQTVSNNSFQDIELNTKLQLHENYLSDNRPWVIAYSGGKDSTLVFQLVYEMIQSLPPEKLKPVHLVASDTKVEAPNIADYVENNLKTIANNAEKSGLDIKVHLVRPEIENSFWINIIGKGYPPPNRWFRWCTTKLKIKPVRKAIEQITKSYGSVVLLLGTRLAESSNRSRQMKARDYNSKGMNPHHEIPNALVMQPIANWTTEEVWDYLYTNNPAPWGGTHDEMLSLYRQANSGECPVIMDLETPACGGNRFGCWTCTVVKEDKSMKGFINSGDEWMMPLQEFRQKLKDWREDESLRHKYKRDGRPGLGPFNSSTRQIILQNLLEVEKKVDRQLISDEELIAIQEIWKNEFDALKSAIKIAWKYGRTPMIKESSSG